MLSEILGVKNIETELKWLWNSVHREIMFEKNNITDNQLEAYLRADCGMLDFNSEKTRMRAAKVLKELGATGFIFVNSYRDVILQQAYYAKNKKFMNNITHENV